MDILICGPETFSDYVILTLRAYPLPETHIYTAVSWQSPTEVRVQVMEAIMARNPMIDTGRRISETAESLEAACKKMIERLLPIILYCDDDCASELRDTAGHQYHCPRCNEHLDSLFICPKCSEHRRPNEEFSPFV